MFNKYNIDKVSNFDDASSHMREDSKHEDGLRAPYVQDTSSPRQEGGDNVMMSAERNSQENVENLDQVEAAEEEEQAPPKKCDWVGWIIRIAIVLALIGFIVWIIVDSKRVTDGFESFIDFLRDNPILAPFILIVVYAIATVVFLPGLILTLGAGFAFNEAYGNAGSKLNLFMNYANHFTL